MADRLLIFLEKQILIMSKPGKQVINTVENIRAANWEITAPFSFLTKEPLDLIKPKQDTYLPF